MVEMLLPCQEFQHSTGTASPLSKLGVCCRPEGRYNRKERTTNLSDSEQTARLERRRELLRSIQRQIATALETAIEDVDREFPPLPTRTLAQLLFAASKCEPPLGDAPGDLGIAKEADGFVDGDGI